MLGAAAPDQRVAVDARTAPWSSLARVQIPGTARCTGVVVGARQVLTAAHCLFNAATGHFVPPGSVHVLTGYAAGGFAQHGVAATYRTAPGWLPGKAMFGADAALLTLVDPVAAPALGVVADAGGAVQLGGYNQDRVEIIEADRDCRITGRAADAAGQAVLRHDCAATRGTSGAPLLVRAGLGWAVAGLQTGASAGRGGVAVPAATLLALLAGP